MVEGGDGASCDALGDAHALFRGLVRQHGACGYITDGPYSGQVGPAQGIHFNEASCIEFQADLFGAQSGGVGAPAYRHDELVEAGLLHGIKPTARNATVHRFSKSWQQSSRP